MRNLKLEIVQSNGTTYNMQSNDFNTFKLYNHRIRIMTGNATISYVIFNIVTNSSTPITFLNFCQYYSGEKLVVLPEINGNIISYYMIVNNVYKIASLNYLTISTYDLSFKRFNGNISTIQFNLTENNFYDTVIEI